MIPTVNPRLVVCVWCLLAVVLGGCKNGSDDQLITPDRSIKTLDVRPSFQLPRHVVIVSIDTLRQDHLGCYGYQAPTSPSIDRFADNSVVFELAIAQAPSTLPSHASIFTSLIPEHHGAFYRRETGLTPDTPTIASIMKSMGFVTAAFTGGGQMARVWGLDIGFDEYNVHSKNENFTDTVNEALAWLDALESDRAFLFLHTYEAHHPYTPTEEFLAEFSKGYTGSLPQSIPTQLLININSGRRVIDEDDLAYIVAAYDAEIRSVDHGWSVLLEGLEARGILDQSLIVFTSDHGEEFGEHGSVGWHSHTLYDELLRVPLVVRFPGGWGGGTRVPHQVRSIDIAPTVLATLGVETPPSFDGVNLLSILDSPGSFPDLPAVSQQDTPRHLQLYSARTESFKLLPRRLHAYSSFRPMGFLPKIARRTSEFFDPYALFDLERDPGETTDISQLDKGRAADMEALLESLTSSRPSRDGRPVSVDRETADRLRALGYIDDGAN